MQGGAKLIELSGTEINHEKTVLSKIFSSLHICTIYRSQPVFRHHSQRPGSFLPFPTISGTVLAIEFVKTKFHNSIFSGQGDVPRPGDDGWTVGGEGGQGKGCALLRGTHKVEHDNVCLLNISFIKCFFIRRGRKVSKDPTKDAYSYFAKVLFIKYLQQFHKKIIVIFQTYCPITFDSAADFS